MKDTELPPEKQGALRYATRLEWITLAYQVSVVVAIYFTLGSSQAMKATWIEDLLGLVPPISFLIATKVRYRDPTDRFPYGYHRAVSVGFLCGSLALLVLGLYILYDSAIRISAFEHPSIGIVQPLGEPIWLGWLMLLTLTWGVVPPVIIGRLKLPVARELHDKILYSDAEMQRANWLTAGAAMLGVIGIRFGFWWADAVAAIVIGADITRDGLRTTRQAVSDLMDARPKSVQGDRSEGVPARIENELRSLSWVDDVKVRMREEGHVFYGDALVVVSDERELLSKIEKATGHITALDWRIYDFVISPASSLDELSEEHDLPD